MNDGYAKAKEHGCESHQAIKAMLTTLKDRTDIDVATMCPDSFLAKTRTKANRK